MRPGEQPRLARSSDGGAQPSAPQPSSRTPRRRRPAGIRDFSERCCRSCRASGLIGPSTSTVMWQSTSPATKPTSCSVAELREFLAGSFRDAWRTATLLCVPVLGVAIRSYSTRNHGRSIRVRRAATAPLLVVLVGCCVQHQCWQIGNDLGGRALRPLQCHVASPHGE